MLEFFEKWLFAVSSNHSCEVHMFPHVFDHNYVVYENVIQRGKSGRSDHSKAAGRQRTHSGEAGRAEVRISRPLPLL